MSIQTKYFELDYFKEGSEYLSELERRRFLTVDYNFESYVGIVGVGVIDGWLIEEDSGTTVKILPGTGIIDGFSAESPYEVKRRSDMVSGNREMYTVSINDEPIPNMTDEQADNYIDIIQEYEPSFNPVTPIEDAYVKVVTPESITLGNDEDYYIYVTRKYTNFYPALSDHPPYLVDIPNEIDYDTINDYFDASDLYEAQMEEIRNYSYMTSPDNHFTEVVFNYSTSFSVSPNKVLIGKVATRSNSISNISYDGVEKLKNLESTISKYAKKVIPRHIHGGTKGFDPDRINLETDIRDAALISYNQQNQSGTFGVLESQLTSKSSGHRHTIFIDENGNGQTIGIIGDSTAHFHKIINGQMQEPENAIEDIEAHVHELPSLSNFVWDDDSDFIVYLNNVPIGDKDSENISVNIDKKTITINGSLGVNNKTYGIDFEFSGGSFSYESQDNTAYRFMQRAISNFNQTYPNLDIRDNPFVFLNEETNTIAGFDDLKRQCLSADSLMNKAGDSFLLTPDAAENIEIKLIQYEKKEGLEANKITIEVLGNSEVQGLIRGESIVFVNALKIASGIFQIERIPFISHVGRINEDLSPFDYYLISQNGIDFSAMPSITDFSLDHFHDIQIDLNYNGITESTYISDEPILYASGETGNNYLIAHTHSINGGEIKDSSSDGLLQWYNENNDDQKNSSNHEHNIIYPVASNSKVIYSIHEDDLNNMYIGTSDGLIMVPNQESYLFVINNYQYYELGDDLLTMFERAKYKYEEQSGSPLNISSDVYQYQISIAGNSLLNDGDSYLIIGKSTPTSIPDQTMIQKVGYIPVPNYKFVSLKEIEEVDEGDSIVEIQLRDSGSGALLDPDNQAVKEQIEEDPDSVKLLAKTEKYLDFIPVKNIEIQKIDDNGLINRKILTVAGEYLATNQNINENFYFNWDSPNTPPNVSSFNTARKDNEENIWVASDNGVYVTRSYNKRGVLSPTSRVGQSLFINDIFPITSNNVVCCSDGIYKTENQGKSWEKKIDGDFLRINIDYAAISVVASDGHTHDISVNINGDGTLIEENGHTHQVIKWVVEENDGHSHEIVFPIYSSTNNAIFKSEDNAETWSEVSKFPSGKEVGNFFVFNSTIYLALNDGLYIYSGEWTRILEKDIYSFQFFYDLSGFYLGSENILYKTDGGDILEHKNFPGFGLPKLFVNFTGKKFGYLYSNKEQKFYFRYLPQEIIDIRARIDFNKWIAESGRWQETDPYDIYIKEKLILSTKNEIDNTEERGYSFTVNPNQGIIDFSGFSNVQQKLNFYDNFIEVDDTSQFQIGDEILIKSLKEIDRTEIEVTDKASAEEKAKQTRDNEIIKRSYFYATITNKFDNYINFSPRSNIDIELPIGVYKIPSLGSDSSIVMNIYNSPLYNIGKNQHKEIEDKLSYTSDQRPYDLNNSYLSNLLEITQAVRYVYPDINSEMINSLFYDFHYSENPIDENYYENYIDSINSDLYSLINFSSEISPYGSSVINKIFIGTGSFSGKVFVGTDIGIFWSEFDESLGSNWFYIFDIKAPVYDIRVFGQDFLFIATSEGLYVTEDMEIFSLQSQEQINFPCYSLSLRWPDSDFFTIPYHDAIFENIKDESGNNVGGKIRAIGATEYSSLIEGKAIRVKTFDSENSKNNTSYIINKVSSTEITLTSSFDVDYEIINVEITTGSWWQNFSGEDNLNSLSITNTLVVGGDNKISYSPYVDQFIWNSSIVPEEVARYNLVEFLPISNGLILGLANSNLEENLINYILKSSDIGQNWSVKNKFEKISGNIISSKITKFNNSEITVKYNYPEGLRYSDNEFDKQEIYFYDKEGLNLLLKGKIIGNNWAKSTIVVFDQLVNELFSESTDITFTIYPININSMTETEDEKIIYGNTSGLFEDKKTTNGTFPIEGEVKSVGNSGSVNNIDISGEIKSVYKNEVSENAVFSIYSNSNITKDQFKDKTIYVLNLEELLELRVVANSERVSEGELTVEVNRAFSEDFLTYPGKNVKLVSDSSVISVDFNLPVQINELNGGTLTVSSNENSNYGKVYNIIRNNENEITLSEKIKPIDIENRDFENKDLISGQKFVALDNSGKLKINVVFFRDVDNNEFSDFDFKITNEDSDIAGLDGVNVHQNSKNTLILDNFQELIGEISLANAIKANDSFSISGQVYQPLVSFNDKKTSENSFHYHETDLIGQFLKGNISSFISNENLIVEFEVSDSELFNSPLVQKDNSLFLGARIRFYNPQNIGVEYFSEVIEHSSNSIKVKLLKRSSWNFDEYSQINISTGWYWEIDSRSYGFTKNTFYKDIPIKSYKVIQNINSGDTIVKVEDTTTLNINEKIILSSSENSEINFVKSIIDQNFFELLYPSQKSFFIERDVYVKVLSDYFSNSHEHIIRNNEIEKLSIQEYNDIGLPVSHSHRVVALIENVLDIKNSEGEIFVAGSGSKIYKTTDSGASWSELVDLNSSTEDGYTVNGVSEIDVFSGQIIAGTMNGRIFSNKYKGTAIIPLAKPEI
jgi:hypothetical protein